MIQAEEIDNINILQASLRAMELAVANLDGPYPNFVLIDGNQHPKVFSPPDLLLMRTPELSQAASIILVKVTACGNLTCGMVLEWQRRRAAYMQGLTSQSRTVVKGDATCQVIAAASILAKVNAVNLLEGSQKCLLLEGSKERSGQGLGVTIQRTIDEISQEQVVSIGGKHLDALTK